MESNINDNADVSASQAKRILAYMEDGNSRGPEKILLFQARCPHSGYFRVIGRPVPPPASQGP